MRYRAVVLSLCAVLGGGVVAAPPAAASSASCVDQLIVDLLTAPIPDPTTIVVVDELNVHVDTTGVSAFSTHVRDAALAFANCATPNPNEILPCVLAVERAIVSSIVNQSSDEIYLRYVHSHAGGVSVYGETAVADASAIAACL